MTTLSRPTNQRLWHQALGPAVEFPATPLPVVAGTLPPDLQGTLYRNGPGRLERGERTVGHWFDGDGGILAVRISNGAAAATYRYVKTEGYQQEEQAGTLLFGGYGMTAPGPIWNQWRRPLKNAANTSVLALPDRLLALWEGGRPHALTLDTLATLGEVNLAALDDSLPFSAHPKRDPKTGMIYNFGVSIAPKPVLNVYRCDRTGQIQQHQTVALSGVPLMHDFILAGDYLVFILPPVRLNLLPAAIGFKSFSDSLEWQPEQGTEIVILASQTLQIVSRQQVEPWFQWHCSNGFVDDDGQLVLDVLHYDDFRTNQRLKEVATGRTTTDAKGTLRRLWVNPQTGDLLRQAVLVDRHCEFPTVPPDQVGQNASHTYLSIHRATADTQRDVFGAIARYDHQAQQLTVADCGAGRYPSEPLYVPPARDSQAGWVLTLVYDGHQDASEVWIYECDRLEAEPICRLGLPHKIPLGFHGTWASAS